MTNAVELRGFERFAEDVWITTKPQRFWGLEVGTRMTLVRLSDGSVLVHGPVALEPETREAVESLGPVCAIVCASLYHHLYAGDWAQAFPDAILCACPGLERKRRDLPFDHVMGDEPHELWAADLRQVYFSARFEHEVVFYHPKSRTMICLDALLNVGSHPKWTTRAVAKLMLNTAPGKGYLERIAVGNRATARREVRRIMEWDVDGIVLAHGGLVRNDGRRVFRDAYAWLGP